MGYRRRCRLCRSGREVDYKDVEFLKKFINRRGRIVPSSRTGNCAKHQREINRAIKRARNIALLPFTR